MTDDLVSQIALVIAFELMAGGIVIMALSGRLLWPAKDRNPLAGRLTAEQRVALASPKPRVRMTGRGGWIRHDGGSFPFHPRTFVAVVFEGGSLEGTAPGPADQWNDTWWRQQASDPRYNIIFYRIADYVPRPVAVTELPA